MGRFLRALFLIVLVIISVIALILASPKGIIPVMIFGIFLLEFTWRTVFKKSLIKGIFPEFSKVSLFILSLVLIYSFFFSIELLRNLIYSFYDPFIMSYDPEIYFLIFGLIFLGFGALLSIYYALSNKRPSRIKEAILIIYSAISLAMFGTLSFQYLVLSAPAQSMDLLILSEPFLIFPIYNILQAFFIVSAVISDLENPFQEPGFSLSEVNARKTELFVAFVIVSMFFFALESFSTLPWFLIASICSSISMLFLKPIGLILFSHISSTRNQHPKS